jgi:hypothetical protein
MPPPPCSAPVPPSTSVAWAPPRSPAPLPRPIFRRRCCAPVSGAALVSGDAAPPRSPHHCPAPGLQHSGVTALPPVFGTPASLPRPGFHLVGDGAAQAVGGELEAVQAKERRRDLTLGAVAGEIEREEAAQLPARRRRRRSRPARRSSASRMGAWQELDRRISGRPSGGAGA